MCHQESLNYNPFINTEVKGPANDKEYTYGIFKTILFMCHPCELTVLPRDELQIKFGKIFAVSPDTAKQDMESVDNKFLFPSRDEIRKYFHHPLYF